MQNPLVSIIVPIYKVEPYLRRCLDSIVNQTYTNLEIILVDDGSPDGCPQICDEYAAKDDRIVVIHKENGGLSDARNAGLDLCKGGYLTFVDSDDWINLKFIEVLIELIQKEKADLAIGKFEKKYESGQKDERKKNNFSVEILNNKQAIEKLFSKDSVFFGIACGKLYARALFEKIRFPFGMLHEDDYTLYKVLYSSKKIIFLDDPLYFYFQRGSSIMGTAKPCSIRALRAKVERYFFFKEQKEHAIQTLCLKNLCWELLFAYSQEILDKKSIGYASKHEILFHLHICQQDHWESNTSIVEKLLLKFFVYFPCIYTFYQNISPIRVRRI